MKWLNVSPLTLLLLPLKGGQFNVLNFVVNLKIALLHYNDITREEKARVLMLSMCFTIRYCTNHRLVS